MGIVNGLGNLAYGGVQLAVPELAVPGFMLKAGSAWAKGEYLKFAGNVFAGGASLFPVIGSAVQLGVMGLNVFW